VLRRLSSSLGGDMLDRYAVDPGVSRIRRMDQQSPVIDASRVPAAHRIMRMERPASADSILRREPEAAEANPLASARAGLKPLPPKAGHHQTTAGLKGKSDTDADLELIYDQAAAAEPELKEKTTQLAAATNGTPQFSPDGLKAKGRAKEKIIADYGGNAAAICDLVRSTVEYSSFADMLAGLEQCKKDFNVVREKNRFQTPTNAGYRDICLNVKLSNGHVGELQMNLTQLLAAKKDGHKQYDEIRKIEGRFALLQGEIIGPFRKKLDALLAESKAIYSAALERAGGDAAASAASAAAATP